jgi:hypothetical protein
VKRNLLGDISHSLRNIGIADNQIARLNALHGQVGSTYKKQLDIEGSTITISNVGGVNSETIDSKKVTSTKEEIVPTQPFVYYAGNELSGTITSDLRARVQKYFGVPITEDLTDVAKAVSVCIANPARDLTTKEYAILNKILDNKGKVTIFPGSDASIYNTILSGLGSKLKLIQDGVATIGDWVKDNVFISNVSRARLPEIDRGFLNISFTATEIDTILDVYDKNLASADVVNLCSSFVFISASDAGYIFPANLATLLAQEDIDIDWTRNSQITETEYSDDWTLKSKANYITWLGTVSEYLPYGQIPATGYTVPTDSEGFATYEDKDDVDYFGSRLAFWTGRNLVATSFSPLWLNSAWGYANDYSYDIIKFCNWVAYKKLEAWNPLNQMMLNVFPFVPTVTQEGSSGWIYLLGVQSQ